MTMVVRGINATLSTFREVDKRFTAAAAAELEAAAKSIAALARMYAPIDHGDLEKSIRALRVRDTTATKWRVKVGGNIGGRDVDYYALAAHEGRNADPGKGWSLGKKSQEKARRLGVFVGPGYLIRAFRERRSEVTKRIRDALRNEIQAISRKSRGSRKR